MNVFEFRLSDSLILGGGVITHMLRFISNSPQDQLQISFLRECNRTLMKVKRAADYGTFYKSGVTRGNYDDCIG